MLCPYCQTENRDDRETCYQCNKDLSMLRLIVNKAKHHYNSALEHAERGRVDEAIAELKNALDLDSSMVNAHVVLGTLYIKKEQFDEARASWRRGLETDHRFQKAHDYLAKSATAEYVFPVVRKLKTAALALAAVVGLLLLVLITVLVNRQLRVGTDDLVSEIATHPITSGPALDVLRRYASNEKVEQSTREFAAGMLKQAEAERQEKLDLAGLALANNDALLALQVADFLAAKDPDAATLGSVKRIRSLAYQQLIERARERVAAFDRGHEEYDIAIARLRDGMKALKPGEEYNEMQALAERITQKHHERLLADAATEFKTASLEDATKSYLDWKTRYPELDEKLGPLIDARLSAVTTDTLTSVTSAIRRDDFDRARGDIDALRAVFGKAERPQPEQLISAWLGDIARAERARRLEELELAYKNERWDEFLEQTKDLAALTTDTALQEQLTERRGRAEVASARENWEWMEARQARFERGTISNEDAERVLAHQERVLQHLPKNLRSAEGPIAFFAAVSQFKLGRLDEARRLLDKVKQDYPKSPIQKSVANFEKKFAKELNPVPAQPEAERQAEPANATDGKPEANGKPEAKGETAKPSDAAASDNSQNANVTADEAETKPADNPEGGNQSESSTAGEEESGGGDGN